MPVIPCLSPSARACLAADGMGIVEADQPRVVRVARMRAVKGQRVVEPMGLFRRCGDAFRRDLHHIIVVRIESVGRAVERQERLKARIWHQSTLSERDKPLPGDPFHGQAARGALVWLSTA